jgi:two-component system NarL family sensor kinase
VDRVAVIRAALVGAVGMGALIDDRPGLYGAAFVVLIAVAAVYSAALLTLAGRPWLFVSDLALLTALAHASGGAASEVRFAFFAIPVLAALVLRPRATAVASGAVALVYLSLELAAPAPGGVTELVYLAWAAVAAVLLSSVLTQRADAIEQLAAERGRLMVDVLAASDRERRRLAGWLHDGPVQNLLVAGQDLAEAERGDAEALRRARAVVRATVPELRGLLVDLHPGLFASAGFAGALRALAEEQARRGAFAVDVFVDGDGGEHDQLLLSLARELLLNVVRHAGARRVTVAVRHEGSELEVCDDGRGFDAARAASALAGGHIGLASSAERVESLGGRLEVTSEPGAGTRVRVVFP